MITKYNNSDVKRVLEEIGGIAHDKDGNVVFKGLKHLKISIGVKLKFDKVQDAFNVHYEACEKIRKETVAEYYPKGLTNKEESKLQISGNKKYLEMIKKLDVLFNGTSEKDTFEVKFEPIMLALFDKVESEYDFSWLIKKITK
jgi:hypothetical protein